jgi:hypothetical protein
MSRSCTCPAMTASRSIRALRRGRGRAHRDPRREPRLLHYRRDPGSACARRHRAQSHGALFLVDAYQSVGQVPDRRARADIDVLVTGPLKWLLGGPGLSYLYVRDALIRELTPTHGRLVRRGPTVRVRHHELRVPGRRAPLRDGHALAAHGCTPRWAGRRSSTRSASTRSAAERDADGATGRRRARRGFACAAPPIRHSGRRSSMIAHPDPGPPSPARRRRTSSSTSGPDTSASRRTSTTSESEIDHVLDVLTRAAT